MTTVVIDNGTGYTKMGYAGNMEPSYIIPTVVADSYEKVFLSSFISESGISQWIRKDVQPSA
jgi:actin-related protein